jgi:TRAP-type C4-dicarboxylate transport system substrate-binding protein
VRKILEDTARETQAFVHEKAAKDDEELLAKIKAAGTAANTPNKDAFVKASAPVYEDFAKEVPGSKEVIDSAIALGK